MRRPRGNVALACARLEEWGRRVLAKRTHVAKPQQMSRRARATARAHGRRPVIACYLQGRVVLHTQAVQRARTLMRDEETRGRGVFPRRALD